MKLGEWLGGLPRGAIVRGGVKQDPATGKWCALFMTDGKELCSEDEFATRVEAEAYLDEAVQAHGLQAHRLQ
jgi:hypothetical protein